MTRNHSKPNDTTTMNDNIIPTINNTHNRGHSSIHSIANSIKSKFCKQKTITLTDYDPDYKVIYLGNVLTPWAKGDGCTDKPLATLWKNYCSNVKHEIVMKITIRACGIKAITREHGVTEYWANRITYCNAHPDYPRVFCWIYRHEAKKLKQEMRCHAVLCSKDHHPIEMTTILTNKLVMALQEFKKEKRMMENSRLRIQSHYLKHPQLESLDSYNLDSRSSSHDSSDSSNGPSDTNTNSLPRSGFSGIPARKRHLVRGQANYKPPLERSKSAPRLTSIDEEDECNNLSHLFHLL